MPRVSTIIPCHDDGRWVERAIESALAQDYPDHEVLVVDDGSTDTTPAVLARHADRIRVLRQQHRGLSAARNLGIRHAAGEFVAFLDADDRFLPHKLARQVAALEHDPGAGLVYTDAWAETPDGRRIGRDAPRRFPPDRYAAPLFLFRTIWHPSTVMVRRSICEQVGGFDESLLIVEDREFYVRIAHASRILDLREPLIVKTTRPGSLSTQLDRFWAAHAQATDTLAALIPDLVRLKARREAIIDVKAGWHHLSRREHDAARARFRRAIERDPRNLDARRMLIETWLRAAAARLRPVRRTPAGARSPEMRDA